MDYNILRENDIRGNYPNQVNEDVALKIGKAFGYYLNDLNINKCIIGHDNRLSSEELSNSLIDGIISSGIDVYDLGLVTTPMFNYASITNKIPYGIMVTASHNIASDNGFKIFGENYLHLSQEELQIFYDLIKSGVFVDGKGNLNFIDIKNDYVNMIVSKFPKLNKRVVIDCGNGTASIVIKNILSKLIYDVSYINCESDGSFPVHNPDPNVEENLKWLKAMVKLKHADVGLAVDGDCDRVGIVDENGNMISTDYLIGIFANDIIPKNSNKKVIIDVKCSIALEHDINKIGGKSIMVKNGSAYLEKVIHDTPALIGGEYSGHIFFRDDFYGFDDGIYAALRLVKLLTEKNTKCSLLSADMEKYASTPEIRINVSDNIKKSVVNRIKDYCIKKDYKCNFADGVRINYDDGFALIRCSNTGPYLTLRFEASNEIDLNLRKEEFMSLVNDYTK
jgi:phosphomannomutase / phosphoglucomutase